MRAGVLLLLLAAGLVISANGVRATSSARSAQ